EGQRVLASYGRGVEQVVEAILAEAERPLHFTEIAERASERTSRAIDQRRAHSAAASVGILLDLGTYGSERHLRLSSEERDRIVAETEQLLVDGPRERQWHAAEIRAALLEREPAAARADKYVLDYLLRRSSLLRRLGRFIWARGDAATSSERLELREAVVSLLISAGHPLQIKDIEQRLVALRGTNGSIQLNPSDPLIRLDTGVWGLNDRDVPLKRSDQPRLFAALRQALTEAQRGLHISEAHVFLAGAAINISPELAFSIAVLDPGMATAFGRYLYLREWGTPRRESISEALRGLVSDSDHELDLDELTARLEQRLDRRLDRAAVEANLASIREQLRPDEDQVAPSAI
ncbi:MAG: hypothetical protein ACREEX_08700, partial [Caulobacteraceae bacterium]